MCSQGFCTCMSIVFDGFDDVLRGEVSEVKVKQVGVRLNMAGDYVNRRLPLASAERTSEVSPVGWRVFCES